MSYGSSPQPPNWNQQDPRFSQPARQGSAWKWLVGGGVVFLLGFLVCCGGSVALLRFGFGVMTVEVQDQLRDNERVRQHIGEIKEFEIDWSRSFADEDDDTYTYRVKGDKGSGTMKVKHITNDEGNEEIVSASLRLDSGQTIEIAP
jgi:hypothetical protein